MINSVSIKTAVTSIILVSVGIILFLIWLIYIREPLTFTNLPYISYLPLANAILNSLSAFCLVAGYLAIRKRKRELHLKFMLSALTFSFLFLVSYLIIILFMVIHCTREKDWCVFSIFSYWYHIYFCRQ